ncbi:MAG: hypothetical protein MI892_30755 [Desulfobacterales bacterium]|nr:hypothetical protein [Desulfobacterales bacterium]
MEDILGLVLAFFFFLLSMTFCFWVIFKEGGTVWQNSIIKWDRFLGINTSKRAFFLKPWVLKLGSIFLFLFSCLFLYTFVKPFL